MQTVEKYTLANVKVTFIVEDNKVTRDFYKEVNGKSKADHAPSQEWIENLYAQAVNAVTEGKATKEILY